MPLDAGEVTIARKNRLRIVAGGSAMQQPCAAHGEGGCAVHAERPRACRAFECRLYAAHAREGGPLEPRLASVRRARELLARVHASPDAEALRAEPWFAELVTLLEQDFARAVR